MGNSRPFRGNAGFTLLQIMLAVAIVGILAAVAIPAYQDYVTRARVAEALEFADAARIKVEEALAVGNTPDTDLLDNAGKPVDKISALSWVSLPDGGYIVPEMDLPGLGVRKAFALVLNHPGAIGHWSCVNAARFNYPDALADKYLPASCRGDGSKVALAAVQQQPKPQPKPQSGASSSAAPTLAQPNCAADAEALLAETYGGKKVLACFKKCPAGTVRDKSNFTKCNPVVAQASATAGSGSASTALNSCPQGQDCSQGSACPPGEELPGGKCLAKCQPGWEPSDADRSICTIKGSASPFLCLGPKFICERSYKADEAGCPQDKPITANHIENLKDGSRYVIRDCISVSKAFEAVEHNAKNSFCGNYNVVRLQDAHFSCTFPCYGKNCNLETVPDEGLLTWTNPVLDPASGKMRAKTKADLPDQFDSP